MSIESVLKNTVEEAKSRQTAQEGDYKDPETGLLMCGKCHTPKQYHFKTAYIDLGLVPMLCDCQRAQYEAEQKAQADARRARIIAQRKADCFGANDRKAQYTFDTDDRRDEKASDIAQGYVKHFPQMQEQGKGLFFLGNPGTGKTFLACCIANALLEQGRSVRVSTFAEIANHLQSTFDKQSIFDDLNEADLLVLDDLEAQRDTSYMNEVVFTVIDSRCAVKKPLIVTSNITMKDFAEPDTIERRRVFSRLQEMCLPIAVVGSDRRKDTMKAQYKQVLAFLNS